MFIEHKLSIKPRDNAGETPLDLACIRGFDQEDDQNYKKKRLEGGEEATYRYHIVKMLLEQTDKNGKQLINIKYRNYQNGSNCPLHWTIYWADYHLSKLFIETNPRLLFLVNSQDCVPFDMALFGSNPAFESQAIITVDFLLDLVYQVLINADKKMIDFKSFFRKIEEDKKNLARQMTEMPNSNEKTLASLFAVTSKKDKNVVNNSLEITKNFFSKNEQESKNTFKTMLIQRLKKHGKKVTDHSEEEPLEIYKETIELRQTADDRLTYYVQRIIGWYGYFSRASLLINLIKRFNISPFKQLASGWSIVHILIRENRYQLLEYFLKAKYKYRESNYEFDLKEVINIPTINYLNSPLHIAAMFNNYESFKLIYQTGLAEVYQLNQRCIKAIDLIPQNKK